MQARPTTMSQRCFARAEYALKSKRTRSEKSLVDMECKVPRARLIRMIETV
jgi:transposase, IS5 family